MVGASEVQIQEGSVHSQHLVFEVRTKDIRVLRREMAVESAWKGFSLQARSTT
jgi:hypothetical protein